jgi:hypothetical protein
MSNPCKCWWSLSTQTSQLSDKLIYSPTTLCQKAVGAWKRHGSSWAYAPSWHMHPDFIPWTMADKLAISSKLYLLLCSGSWTACHWDSRGLIKSLLLGQKTTKKMQELHVTKPALHTRQHWVVKWGIGNKEASAAR